MKSFARLSRTEYLILDLLQDENRFGLELVERSRGALKRGTVYVTLARMQDKGYVSSRTEALAPGAIGLPRRLYRPTAYGLKVFRVWSRAERALARLRPQEA
jgi:DNA-binding PadR family transcriptional regulator